jgi:hypothetical protein
MTWPLHFLLPNGAAELYHTIEEPAAAYAAALRAYLADIQS